MQGTPSPARHLPCHPGGLCLSFPHPRPAVTRGQAEYRRGGSTTSGAAGVVVSCKIPILATRVRFPGGANPFLGFPLFFFISLPPPPVGGSPHGAWGRIPAGTAGSCSPRSTATARSSHAGAGGGGAQQGPDPGGTAAVRGIRHPRGIRRLEGARGGGGCGTPRRALCPGAAADPLAALRHRAPGAAQHRCLRGGHAGAQHAAPHPAGRLAGLGDVGGHPTRHPRPPRQHQHDAHRGAALHRGPVQGCWGAAEAWRSALHLRALRRGWPDQPPEQRGLRPQPEAEQSRLGSSGHGTAAAAGRGQRAASGEDGGHASQQQESHLPQAVTSPDGTSRHGCPPPPH